MIVPKTRLLKKTLRAYERKNTREGAAFVAGQCENESHISSSSTQKISSTGRSEGGGRWSKAEDNVLRRAVMEAGPRNWKRISAAYFFGSRSDVQCLHRWQKVLRPGLVKGPWTKDEDSTIHYCVANGITKWSEIAMHIPGRIGKQCRERWFNHLDPKSIGLRGQGKRIRY